MSEDDVSESRDDVDDEIKQTFPNWKQDEAYGGQSQFVRISINDQLVTAHFLDKVDRGYVSKKTIDLRTYDFMATYIENLIFNRVIEHNQVYDLADVSFLKQLDKHKKKFTDVVLSEENQELISKFKYVKSNTYNKVVHRLFNNAILNGKIYCDVIGDFIHVDFVVGYEHGFVTPFNISLRKIVGKLYDLSYVRKYLPYVVEVGEDGFYTINRNYEYIGLDTKSNPEKRDKWKRVYVCRGYGVDYENKASFRDTCTRLYEVTKNKVCLNPNRHTDTLLQSAKVG